MHVFLVGYTTLRLLFTVISVYPGHIVAKVILLRAAQGSIPLSAMSPPHISFSFYSIPSSLFLITS